MGNVPYAKKVIENNVSKKSKKIPYRKPTSSKVNKIEKRVKKLSALVEADSSTYIRRGRTYGSVTIAGVRQCKHATVVSNSVAKLEDAINSLKFFDPSTPGTYINVDMSSPAFYNDVYFEPSYASITCRNNYVTPVHCTVYSLVPKRDTSLGPLTCMTDGLADISDGTPTGS